jgi:hypothetical protein
MTGGEDRGRGYVCVCVCVSEREREKGLTSTLTVLLMSFSTVSHCGEDAQEISVMGIFTEEVT